MKIITLKSCLLAIAYVVCLSSCKKTTGEPNVDPNVALTITNVAYASASAQQNMDVYLPANRSATSTYVLIMVHGGSWNGGDKTDFDSYITDLKPMLGNYAIFNINYRLANGSSILVPQQTDDINAAFDFIANHAAEYKVNASKIALMGASAGAHLTLLKAYKANTDGKIKAMIDLFGPTDMAWMYNSHPIPFTQTVVANAVGGTPSTNAAAYTSASPINFVASSAPPTLIFHGTADPVVPISESDKLKAKLQTMGVVHSYITYTGEGHGWNGANLTDTYNKAAEFIKLYVK